MCLLASMAVPCMYSCSSQNHVLSYLPSSMFLSLQHVDPHSSCLADGNLQIRACMISRKVQLNQGNSDEGWFYCTAGAITRTVCSTYHDGAGQEVPGWTPAISLNSCWATGPDACLDPAAAMIQNDQKFDGKLKNSSGEGVCSW
jgi:hypothetical protein